MRRVRPLVLPAAALLAFALAERDWTRPTPFLGLACRFGEPHYADRGEALIHGFQPEGLDLSYHLPLSSLLSALLWHHSPPILWRNWPAAVSAATTLLVFALGALLGSSAGGLLAAALWNAPILGKPPACYPQSAYAVLVLLAACLAAHRARRSSPTRTILLGLGLGASLLFRSPLVFFPPLLLLAQAAGLPGPKRGRLADAALLLSFSYALLFPWIRLNGSAGSAPIPVERGEADQNLVTGALGLVPTVEGDVRELADAPPPELEPGPAHWAWAARTILHRPLRYALSCARRLGYFLRLRPVLLLLGLLGLVFSRRDPAARTVAFLAAYLTGIHCLLSVEEGYFTPVWPLLAALASAPGERLLGIKGRARSSASLLPVGIAWTGLAAVLALSAYCEAGILSFAWSAARRPPGSSFALEEALASSPEDGWLLAQRGARRLRAGELALAAADMARAEELHPGLPGVALRLAWTRALQGNPKALLAYASNAEDSPQTSAQAALLQGEALLRGGDAREARRRLDAAMSLIKGRMIRVRRLETPAEKEALARLESDEAVCARALALLLPFRTGERRFSILPQILRRFPPLASGAPAQAHRRAILLSDLGETRAARGELEGLLKNSPTSAKLWSDKAVAESREGRSEEAVADLKKAIELDPNYLPPYLTLGALLTAQRRYDSARGIYGSALEKGRGGNPGLLELIRKTRDKLPSGSYIMDPK